MNALYDTGRTSLADGTINWYADNIKAVLVDNTYTPDLANHHNLTDIPTGKRVATSPNLTAKTVNVPSTGVYDADDVTFTAVTGATPVAYLILYKDTGTPATSPLILVDDTAGGLPFTPTGVNRTIAWDNGPHRILQTLTVTARSLPVAPAPTPHSYTLGDLAASGSWWGTAMVHLYQWTPDTSGEVVLLPPAVEHDSGGGGYTQRDYYVFPGTVANTDYPDRTSASGTWPGAPLADAFNSYTISDGANYFPDSFYAQAGVTYTIAAVNNDTTPAAGQLVSLLEFYQSVQHLGGVNPLVPPDVGTPIVYGTAGIAPTAALTHGLAATADGTGWAAGDLSHAEGNRTIASGTASHAEGSISKAAGDFAHAEGFQTQATLTGAHAEGNNTQARAAGAHAEGSSTIASGAAAHAEGSLSQALANYSSARGLEALVPAVLPCAEAIAAGHLTALGDAELIRVPLAPTTTTNSTQKTLTVNGGGALAFPSLWPNGVYMIRGRVTARRTDVVGTVSSWTLTALVESSGGVGRLIGQTVTNEYRDAAAAAWVVQVDVHSGADLRVLITGEAGKTIHWVAVLELLVVV